MVVVRADNWLNEKTALYIVPYLIMSNSNILMVEHS